MAVPPGPLATPLGVSVTVPGATASKRIAASRPVPDAPTTSAPREIVMSIRPPLTCWLNTADAPPVRMKGPSCTVRTRSTFGSNVIVRLMVVSRVAPLIDTGTVYGPPPTRNVVPGVEMTTCADPMPGVVIGNSAVGAGGGAGGAGGGCVSTTGGVAGGAAGGVAGGVVGGCTSTVPGTGVDPGGSAITGPGGVAVGLAGGPVTPAGGGGFSGSGAMSGGGPPSVRPEPEPCAPM